MSDFLKPIVLQPPRSFDPADLPELKERLLDSLYEMGLKSALANLGVSVRQLRQWRTEDPSFDLAFSKALVDGTRTALEMVGIDRALEGRSDNLLMFFLKAIDRDRYDDAVARSKAPKEGLTIEIVDAKKPT